MQKRNIVIISIVVFMAVLLAVSLALYFYLTKQSEYEPTTSSSSSTTVTPRKRDVVPPPPPTPTPRASENLNPLKPLAPNLIPQIAPPRQVVIVPTGLQFTAIINWWDKENPDTPMKVAERLQFAPNIGTFFDLQNEWPRDRFAREVEQVLEMKSKHRNLWSPIVLDVAILPRGGLEAFEKLLGQIGDSFRDAEQKGIRVRTRALTEMSGNWFPYSTGNYEEIKSILRKFYTAIKAKSPTTSIMFNPNFSFGGCGAGEKLDARNYDPGSEFWDEVGLDIYRHNPKCVNKEPNGDEIRTAIEACGFYEHIRKSGKPFSVAETSRATKRGCGDIPADFDYRSKSNWLGQLFSPDLKNRFPQLYNVGIFDFLKFEDDEMRDFRVTFEPRLVAMIREAVGAV